MFVWWQIQHNAGIVGSNAYIFQVADAPVRVQRVVREKSCKVGASVQRENILADAGDAVNAAVNGRGGIGVGARYDGK